MTNPFTKTNRNILAAFILGLLAAFGGIYLVITSKNAVCMGDNIGVVKIIGEIDYPHDYDETSVITADVINQIESFNNNEGISAIVLDIDSLGGAPESSERIMLAIRKTSKPVVAMIRNSGASGAYLIASASDRVFASKFSDVGGIGVINAFLDTTEKDRREGAIFYEFSSGKYKGTGMEHSKMTKERRDMVMEGIMESHNIFVNYVSENRGMLIEKVKELATGRTWLGEGALKLGLIDEIGGMREVGAWLAQEIGEYPSYCYMD